VGAVTLGAVVVLLAAAPVFATRDPLAVNVPNRLAGFSWAHPLGTDGIGRDMWSRMMYGGRTSVAVTLGVTTIITVLGVALGVLAGMRGGFVDSVIMRVVEIVQSVPLVIVVMLTVKLLGGGTVDLILVLAAVGWTGQARVVRAATLSLREREFIESCRVIGASRLRIAFRHIVPNLLGPVVVLATLDVGRILLTVSTLSFLGFGARPPKPEWGSMLADARNYFFVAPRLLIIPGVGIFIVAFAANLFGEGLRDSFEARTTAS
ncbi:MAG: peptide/nickel transport system permease protein, partial [Acidimicrobiaceae bacterium]|nr:peptide/nickel transport system permease protein [Acidimicrobiaceae bacterium]